MTNLYHKHNSKHPSLAITLRMFHTFHAVQVVELVFFETCVICPLHYVVLFNPQKPFVIVICPYLSRHGRGIPSRRNEASFKITCDDVVGVCYG